MSLDVWYNSLKKSYGPRMSFEIFRRFKFFNRHRDVRLFGGKKGLVVCAFKELFGLSC